jgi:hypothetical protein
MSIFRKLKKFFGYEEHVPYLSGPRYTKASIKDKKTLRELPMWMQSANGNIPPEVEDIIDEIIKE